MLTEAINNALAAGGQTAAELVTALGAGGVRATRSEVNSLLYRGQGSSFRHDGETRPRWSLVNAASANFQRRIEPSLNPLKSVDTRARLRTWQHEALVAWSAAECRGVVQAVTGTGKTRLGQEAIRAEAARGGRSLVLVPTTALLAQWYDILRKDDPDLRVGRLGDGHTDSFVRHDVLIATPQSAKNGTGFSGGNGLLVADEVHRYGSPTWSEALDEKFPRRLGLSATYQRDDLGNEKYLDPYFGGPEPVYDIGFQRAIADEVVSPFVLAMIGVRFGSYERDVYDQNAMKAWSARKTLLEEFDLPRAPFGEYMREVQQTAHGKLGGKAQKLAWSYLSGFSACRTLLADTSLKVDRALDLSPVVATAHGTLVFTQTVAAAKTVATRFAGFGYSTAAIYGGLDRGEREHILNGFRNQDTTMVSAPRVLDEGIDVPDADLAIVLAASSSRRQMIQRVGRTLRKRPGKVARLVVMYVEGTVEDPNNGAHQSFLDEVTAVTRDIRYFGPNDNANKICAWLLRDQQRLGTAV
jgi:superfamily II DNA or RNA helicase